MKKINNRRYIGCKTKLLENIYETVNKHGFDSSSTVADIFAGTGVVGSYFIDHGYKVLFNDTLYSNVVAYKAFHGKGKVRTRKMGSIIKEFNLIDPDNLEENYFSKIYGDKYFSKNDAKKIGYIRDFIENNKEDFTPREYYYLITSLIYACDKIANTVGHYESYLKNGTEDKGVKLEPLDINNGIPADIYNMDANELVKKLKYDVAYIDPPYNARQYVNFYHVLENLARWNKPEEFEGNSMKFKRNELKSGYCRNNTAPALFEDLINKLKAKLIVVSYNNTYKANSISSVNTISEQQIFEILNKKGKVTRYEYDFGYFNAGKTHFTGHKEYLYVCEVD